MSLQIISCPVTAICKAVGMAYKTPGGSDSKFFILWRERKRNRCAEPWRRIKFIWSDFFGVKERKLTFFFHKTKRMISTLAQSDSLHQVCESGFSFTESRWVFPNILCFSACSIVLSFKYVYFPGWKSDFLVCSYQVLLCGSQTFFCNGSYSSRTVKIALCCLQLQFTRLCHMLRSFTSELLRRLLPNVTQFSSLI